MTYKNDPRGYLKSKPKKRIRPKPYGQLREGGPKATGRPYKPTGVIR